MSTIVSIVSVVLLILFIIFSVQFGILAIGSTDAGVNVSTMPEYESQYRAGQNASISTFALLNNTPLLLGVLILVVAIMGFAAFMGRKSRY